jgi:uncharacterized SAM-binding protein YcdF (DUF218 family)
VAERLAIVVPGHSRRGLVSARCLRLVAAAEALAEASAPEAVVFSGRGEAGAMLAAWRGRLDVELVLEPTARITAENAARTLPLLLERRIGSALVVCGRAHAPRVRFFFGSLYGRYGIETSVAPVSATLHGAALLRELAAAPIARRQRRAALAELETSLRG